MSSIDLDPARGRVDHRERPRRLTYAHLHAADFGPLGVEAPLRPWTDHQQEEDRGDRETCDLNGEGVGSRRDAGADQSPAADHEKGEVNGEELDHEADQGGDQPEFPVHDVPTEDAPPHDVLLAMRTVPPHCIPPVPGVLTDGRELSTAARQAFLAV